MSASDSSAIVDYWIANGFPQQLVSFALYTSKVFDYAVSDDSEKEIEDFYVAGVVNFYEFLCTRSTRDLMTGAKEYTFTLTLNYYRTKSENTDGASWQNVRDLLDNAPYFALQLFGSSWGGYVDYWRPQEETPEIIETEIAGEKVWKGTIQFLGTQTI